MGREEFLAAARHQVPQFGGQRLSHKIADWFFDALTDSAGVSSQRRGALERVRLLLSDWRSALDRMSDVEQRMVGVLDAMGLTELVASIPGVSAVGAAVILAETGDPTRFASARSVVKHAGLNPTENTSATLRGKTRVSHRGRPGYALAAWRAVWTALQAQPCARRQVHPPDHPRPRPTHRRTSPRRLRRNAAALALRHRHPPPNLEPRPRRPPHTPASTHRRRGLTTPARTGLVRADDNFIDHLPVAGASPHSA